MNHKFYRPEIDGLRALAIVSVVLFHAKIFGFTGGFVGVDVFFVISGYLITSILIREMNGGTFSFIKFWERRMRRILPILSVVIIAVIIGGYFLLLFQDELLDLGQSVFAQSIFLSNIFFLRGHGYFGATADTFPLLHTWSLSVEEQFYVGFPLILFVIFTFWKRRLLAIMIFLTVVSFAVNMYLVNIAPGRSFTIPLLPDLWKGTPNITVAFYLLPSRAWELLFGSLIALSAVSIESRLLAELFAGGGLVAILYSVTQFTSETPFPGILALIPTLGSVGIIVSSTTTKTYVTRLLSLPGIVWVGLISYSLYLWHWPILVFANTIFVKLNMLQTIGLILISVILSWLTYLFIETPFRKKFIFTPQTVIVFGLVSLAAIGLLGLSLKYVDTATRIPAFAKNLLTESFKTGEKFQECHDAKEQGRCLVGVEDENILPTFMMWGDSQAAPLLESIDRLSRERNIKGIYFSYPGCAHIIGVSSVPPIEECEKTKTVAWDYIREHDIKNVLLASGWGIYTRESDDGSKTNLIVDEGSQDVSESESKQVFKEHFTDMIERLYSGNRNVYILKQIPFHENLDMRKAFYSSIHAGHVVSFDSVPLSVHSEYNKFSDSLFDTLENDGLLVTLNPADILCSVKDGCSAVSAGRIIYEDGGHLNNLGAKMLEPLIQKFLDATQNQKTDAP